MNSLNINDCLPITVFAADWVLPVSSQPVTQGAVAICDSKIVGVGTRAQILADFPNVKPRDFGEAAILPGFVNAHTHLELTALRNFLDSAENDFPAWLLKLATARDRRMNVADLENSALCGAIEAARAGVTCVGDIGKHAFAGAKALRETGLRAVSFQENSFGLDHNKAHELFGEIIEKLAYSEQFANERVTLGITPHAPYTVSARLFELITDLALQQNLKISVHAAESKAEEDLMRRGTGSIAALISNLGVRWKSPGVSSVQYLHQLGVLQTAPLLAHCVNVDKADLEIIRETNSKIAHCPKSNAKFAHGVAPFAEFLKHNVKAGLGSDSVASNNTCDLLEEARFAVLMQRASGEFVDASEILRAATLGGAESLGLDQETGSLDAGKQADLCVVAFDSIQQQPVFSPEACLIFASSARAVVLTMVAGETIFDDGVVKTVDESEARAKLRETARKISE